MTALILGLLMMVVATAEAQEARCGVIEAAGGTCICAESMNTSTFVLPPNAGDFGIGFPDGAPSKKCAYLGIANTAGEIPIAGRGNIFQRNDAATITALTGTGIPSFVHSGIEGQTGAWQLAHTPLPATNQARVALRYYHFWSSNFQLTTGGCLNSGKEAAVHIPSPSPSGLGGYTSQGQSGTGWDLTSFAGFTPAPDCCGTAPGGNPQNVHDYVRNGRWIRMEWILVNSAASGYQLRLYGQDVTRGITRLNNGNEFTILDSSVACSQAPYPSGCDGTTTGWTSAMATSLTPPAPADYLYIFGFRNGTCAGFQAYSYMLAASWTTNAGQRIGPASEIEGGAQVPGTPTGLSVTKAVTLSPQAVAAIRSR